jgi:hypothetical protein
VANIYQIKVGRLVEVRLDSHIRTVADVNDWFNGVGAALATLPRGQRGVVVADWRICPLLSIEASQCAVTRLTKINPHVERSAALASLDSSITVLQFLRVIRESHHPSRRLFTDPERMLTWLAEVLTPLEQHRLGEFLREETDRSAAVGS